MTVGLNIVLSLLRLTNLTHLTCAIMLIVSAAAQVHPVTHNN